MKNTLTVTRTEKGMETETAQGMETATETHPGAVNRPNTSVATCKSRYSMTS